MKSAKRGMKDLLQQKMFLSRYYFHLGNVVNECKEKYADDPKKTARKLIFWNLKQSLKIFSKKHEFDYYENYQDRSYRNITGRKVMFPYEQIIKDSKVAVLGANDCARQIIKQNNITKYCKIVGVIDAEDQYQEKELETIPVYKKIAKINKLDLDYLIIATLDKSKQQEIFGKLVSLGFPIHKGIFSLKEAEIVNSSIIDSRVKVCVIITGGLGDYIIEKRALLELQKLEDNLVFYLTTEDLRKKVFLDTVFFDMDKTYLTYENENEINYSDYDLVMRIDHIMHILYVDMNSLRNKSRSIFNFATYWAENYDDIKHLNPRIPYESVIHVNRAKIKGLDRYSIMGFYTTLEISDHKVPIGLKADEYDEYNSLNLPEKYITVNLGADARPDGLMQVKTWPIQNYESLIGLIKQKYSNIKIVQIGNVNSAKFKGADGYVFGRHIDVIKYVLRDSSLHIDCEGGLVHLATQFGTKCAVLFGPTPDFYYGYKENINIQSLECGNCMGTTEEWYTHCLLGDKYPARCMMSITPEYVMERIDVELKRINEKSK